jgi:hypothetical protein
MTKQHPIRGEVGQLRWFVWKFERAIYNTKFPWRATLLIFAIAPVVHSPFGYTFVVYVCFIICGYLDQMNKYQAFENEMEGWEEDPNDPSYEIKGNLSRVRLTGQNQIVAHRLAELLTRMP